MVLRHDADGVEWSSERMTLGVDGMTVDEAKHAVMEGANSYKQTPLVVVMFAPHDAVDEDGRTARERLVVTTDFKTLGGGKTSNPVTLRVDAVSLALKSTTDEIL